MRIRSRGALTLLAAATMVATACSTPAASSGAERGPGHHAPRPTARARRPPPRAGRYTGTLKDGSTFTLHPRVADEAGRR